MKILTQLILCFFLMPCIAQNQLISKLEKYMDAEATINDFVGTVLLTRNDSTLLKKSYGFANYEWKIKNTIDTKFSLASVSKQFTAAAILQLAENNDLSINDKLAKYYPSIPKGDEITIKMLLSHNSGISNDNDEIFSSNTSLESDSVVKLIMTKPFLFNPGTQASYSNEGYYILATLIEKVSGKSYASYLKEYIFDAANMNNSGVSSNDSIFLKMSNAYYKKDRVLIKNPYSNWKYNIGMDGVYSTVEDLYLWNKHLFDSTTILSEESKKLMFTSSNDSDFGFGVMVNPFYNHGHDLIAHDGGFYGVQTSFNKFTDDNVLVVVLSNNESASYLIAYGLAAIVFGIPVDLPYKHTKVQVDPVIYSSYVGVYEGVKIHQKDGKLFYSDYDIELIPESKTKFFRSDNNNRTIEFVHNQNGKVIQIVLTKAGVKETKNRDK